MKFNIYIFILIQKYFKFKVLIFNYINLFSYILNKNYLFNTKMINETQESSFENDFFTENIKTLLEKSFTQNNEDH